MRARILSKQLNWAGVTQKIEEKATDDLPNDASYALKSDLVELQRQLQSFMQKNDQDNTN